MSSSVALLVLLYSFCEFCMCEYMGSGCLVFDDAFKMRQPAGGSAVASPISPRRAPLLELGFRRFLVHIPDLAGGSALADLSAAGTAPNIAPAHHLLRRALLVQILGKG